MKNIERKALSILTAIVMWNATNTYVINKTYFKPLTRIVLNGEEKYVAVDGIFDQMTNTEKVSYTQTLKSVLANENYLNEQSEDLNIVGETPKIKKRKYTNMRKQ